MSRDRLKEDQNKNSLERMASLGRAALTVGVGAALFYRGGGSKALSEGAELSGRFLKEAINDVSSKNLRDLDAKEIGNMYKRLVGDQNSSLNKIREEMKNKTLKLRHDDSRSIFGAVRDYVDIKSNGGKGILNHKYNREKIGIPTANLFRDKFAKGDSVLGRNVERFAFEASSKAADPIAMDRIARKHKLDKSLSNKNIQEMTDHIRTLLDKKSNDFEEFAKEHRGMIESTIDKISDPSELARVYGAKGKEAKSQKWVDSILGDSRATIDDLINGVTSKKFETSGKIFYKTGSEQKAVDPIEQLIKMKQDFAKIDPAKAEEFGKIFVDPSLRIDKSGEIYSFKDATKMYDKMVSSAASTLPGKILKLRDYENRNSPLISFSGSGTVDPILASLNKFNTGDKLQTDDSFMRILDRTYRAGKDGLEHVKELDGSYLMSGRYGTKPKLLKQLMGDIDTRDISNPLIDKLDIFKDGSPAAWDKAMSRFKKFGNKDWRGNVVDDLLNVSEEDLLRFSRNREEALKGNITDEALESAKDYIQKAQSLNFFYSKNSYELGNEAVNKLKKASPDNVLFSYLSLDEESLLENLLTHRQSDISSGQYFNKDLGTLLNKYLTDPKGAKDAISIKSDRSNFFEGTETAGFYDILKMEVAKEAFISHAAKNSTGGAANFDSVHELIEGAGLSESAKKETRRLADWAGFQYLSGVSTGATRGMESSDIIEAADSVQKLIAKTAEDGYTNGSFKKQMREDLMALSKEKISKFEESYDTYVQNNDSLVKGNDYGNWIHQRKGISPIDVIKNINDETIRKGFVRQFGAGRNNPQDITDLTLIPYFSLVRLSDGLNGIGLGFSAESIGSSGDLIKNIALKRVLPVTLGLAYMDYANDMSREILGTSFTGAMANSAAAMDLGMRRITDSTGLSRAIKKEKEINPILSYWTGDDYQGYEERQEWYRDGYSEMRKSRWWSFGSLSEFRGSEIAYYQPNYLRRIHSNYKNEALYDSAWEKWSRSPLPTPTAPLSTIRYLMNPYWLEEKHKDDRPYPMTGKLFPEETPWGVVLNPTLGEVIKPQKRMHEDRLGRSMVDVKAIIESRNIEQHRKAKDKNNNNLIRFKDGVIEPVDFSTFQAPTMSERVISLQIRDGELTNNPYLSYGEHSEITHASQVAPTFTAPPGMPEGMSFEQKNEIRAQRNSLPANIIRNILNTNPRAQIEDLNKATLERAGMSVTPQEKGAVTSASIHKTQARFGSHILDNREALADLRGLNSGDDFLGELAYTTRYMTGIYGYGTYRLFPGQTRKKLAEAGDMTSPVRGFWDANIGGLGGGYVEIFRRFIPFQNRRAERINPLLNTMPDWMPERFRFGDPYTQLPKGEMRLPGKGFESLHDLNPDEYGDYGAFDRFKILADIAPYSTEYKVWRDIASKTVSDPKLREEMQAIRERVSEQSKKYDFHNYKFLGRRLEDKHATIDKVIDNNHFQVVGSDQIYRLAGVSVGPDENGESVLDKHLSPGMQVVLGLDANEHSGRNEDAKNSINAAVFIDGQNLSNTLEDMGLAERRRNDMSAAASVARYSEMQRIRGSIFEAISHAPLPYVQQKFMKIRTPLESYKHEQIYGTPYASWSNPIQSFVNTAKERAIASDMEMAIGVASLYLHKVVTDGSNSKLVNNIANAGLMMTNRGAFAGAFTSMAIKGGGKHAKIGAQIGALGTVARYMYSRKDKPVENTINMALVGGALANQLYGLKNTKYGALIGAAVGLISAGGQVSLFDKDEIRAPWVPDRTKEKWELQEYFDRLSYIKYSGLYEKAARKAFLFEGTDIKRLVNIYEQEREEKHLLKTELEENRALIESSYAPGDERAVAMIQEIDEKLSSLTDSEFMLSAGKWGRTALMYKQAADSTIYGLSEDASMSQLLRSLPKNERDYFIEFAKETDPKKRKEILKYVSPYQRKALQIAWGEEVDKQESMSSFFSRHKMPAPMWSGWRPGVDLKDVEIKTIHNEGMMLSDFGHYESQLREDSVINAPTSGYGAGGVINPVKLRADLLASLHGFGLLGVNVSVEPKSSPGVEVAADIIRTSQYNIQQTLGGLFR